MKNSESGSSLVFCSYSQVSAIKPHGHKFTLNAKYRSLQKRRRLDKENKNLKFELTIFYFRVFFIRECVIRYYACGRPKRDGWKIKKLDYSRFINYNAGGSVEGMFHQRRKSF